MMHEPHFFADESYFEIFKVTLVREKVRFSKKYSDFIILPSNQREGYTIESDEVFELI